MIESRRDGESEGDESRSSTRGSTTLPIWARALDVLALASLFVAIAAVTDSTCAVAAGAAAPHRTRARGVRSLGRYLTGGAFIGLGVLTAVTGSRRP